MKTFYKNKSLALEPRNLIEIRINFFQSYSVFILQSTVYFIVTESFPGKNKLRTFHFNFTDSCKKYF